MIYDQLIKICEINGIKPTPVLRSLGLSSGSLKSWKNGSGVNSDTLKALADYFDVPVDYFFEDNTSPCNSDIFIKSSDKYPGFSFKNIFNILKAHPDHIISMIAMFTVGPGVLERISKYMSCNIDCLINTGIKVDENNKAQSVKSTKEIILDILNALPGNKEYKNLQVYISTVIITNLLKLGIGKSKLIEAGLVVKKIEKLYDFEADSSTKTPLNLSDLMNLSNKLAINYDTMLTGRVVKISEDE